MKKIATLTGVTSIPNFYNGMVVVFNKNKLLFISEQTYEVIHEIDFEVWHPLDVLDGKLFMYNTDLFVYDDKIKDFVLYERSLSGGVVSPFADKIIENKYDAGTENVQITLYERENRKKLWERIYPNRIGWFRMGNYLYVSDLMYRYIDFIDESTGNIRNTLEFEKYPISRFLYYFDHTLIVSLQIKPLEEYHLLGLDSETGEEKWRIEDARYLYNQDIANGYLYCIGGNLFQVIDAKNGKLLYHEDFSEEIAKHKVFPERDGCLSSDGLYFYSNYPDSKFGLINLQTHKIEFVKNVDVKEGVKLTDILCHNDKVYILDVGDGVQIWGKE